MIKLKSILSESIRLKNLLLQEVDVKIGSQTSGLMQVSRRANNDTVNQELLDDIKTAARNANVKIQISWAMSGHSTKTVTGNISRHSTNDAVDISMLQDLDDSNETKLRGAGGASNSSNGKKTFRDAGNRLKDALVALGYNWNSERGHQKAVLWQTNIGGNHFNHLHVSNKDGGTSSRSTSNSKDTEKVVSIDLDMIPGLKYGSRGQGVREMQEHLIYLGFSVGPMMNDGIFGSYTLGGVKDFQKANNIEVTGVYDESSDAILKKLTKKIKKSEIKKVVANKKDASKISTIISDKDYNRKDAKKWGQDVIDALDTAALKHNIDKEILYTIANIESTGNPEAKNKRSGASGLFQIMPKYFSDYGVTKETVWNPYVNAEAAAKKIVKRMSSINAILNSNDKPNIGAYVYMAHNQGLAGFKIIYKACKLYSSMSAEQALIKASADFGRTQSFGKRIFRNMKGNGKDTPCEFIDTWISKYNTNKARIQRMV